VCRQGDTVARRIPKKQREETLAIGLLLVSARMTIAKITGPGLAALSVSVALLWGCVIAERALVRRSALEQARVLHEIRLLRERHAEPAADPQPHFFRPRRRSAAG